VDRDLGEYFGVTDGLLVVKVRSDSGMPLKAGDVSSASTVASRRPRPTRSASRGRTTRESVKLDIQRKQRRQSVTWTVPERRSFRVRPTPRPARAPRPERSEEG
jgi:hypothetical protein